MRRLGKKFLWTLGSIALAILAIALIVIVIQTFSQSRSDNHQSLTPTVVSQVPLDTPTDIPTPELTPTQAIPTPVPTPTPAPTLTPLDVQITATDLGVCHWTLVVGGYSPDATLHITWTNPAGYTGTSVTLKAPFTTTVTVANEQVSGSATISKTCP